MYDYDKLAIEYKTASDRRKGNIVIIIRGVYLNKIKRMAYTVIERDLDDFWQIYDMRIIYALNTWEQRAKFTTYLYSIIRGTLNVYLNNDYKTLFPKRYKKYDNEPLNIILLDDMDYTKEYLINNIHDENWNHVKSIVNKE